MQAMHHLRLKTHNSIETTISRLFLLNYTKMIIYSKVKQHCALLWK